MDGLVGRSEHGDETILALDLDPQRASLVLKMIWAMGRYWTFRKVFPVVSLLMPSLALAQALPLVPIEQLGLRAPMGFRVTVYADERFANDVYAMTLDSQGR